MDVLVTGATGFIGRSLVLDLQRRGHIVTAWVRNVAGARQTLAANIVLVPATDEALHQVMPHSDAVINLAGEPVVGRWTRRRRASILSSRIDTTRRLVQAMHQARGASSESRPRVLVSASAVGYYGSRDDQTLTEDSPAGDGFLAGVCQAWEAEALRAPTGVLHSPLQTGSLAPRAAGPHLRVVLPRIGVVLGAGGALQRLVPLFRRGLGGKLGHGRQWMPWIHVEDLVQLLVWAMETETVEGPLNAVAPEPVTNLQFTRTLGRTLGRSTRLAVPGWLLRLAMGQASQVLLASQRAVPAAAQRHGFSFRFRSLQHALDDLVNPHPLPIERPQSHPGS